MAKEREQLAEAVLNHALEIICLLTVEDFIVVKRPSKRTRCAYSIRATEVNSNTCDSSSGCPELLFTLQGVQSKTQRMIVELANKIAWLMSREVPVKCEDVALYSNLNKCDDLEGHGEQYQNDQDTFTIEQPTSPEQQSSEDNFPINCCIKEEPVEELYHTTDDTSALPSSEIIPEIPAGKPLPTINVYIPVMEGQTAYFKPDPDRGSSEDTMDSMNAESPKYPRSPYQETEYAIIYSVEEESEESQDLYIEDTVNPTDKDEEYLPENTNFKKARTRKSRPKKPSPPCEVCGKVFSCKSTLEKHMQIHTGQRPFPCNECGKRFSSRNHLTTHERSHSGERPFACNQCDRRFFKQQHLNLHQVTHTGEKPFSCPVCGKGFTRQSSVVKHSGMHAEQKPFVCKECGKSYCQYANLVVHQRLHSGEKPFACKYCEKAFICKDTMLRHQWSHTGEKPFPCPYCDKRFMDKSTLNNHKRRIHDKEPNPA